MRPVLGVAVAVVVFENKQSKLKIGEMSSATNGGMMRLVVSSSNNTGRSTTNAKQSSSRVAGKSAKGGPA